MEIAKLLHKNIRLDEERLKYENDGFQWPEIERKLNNLYRTHSDKNAFTCLCCGKPVKMVLISTKTCHFRHLHEDPCPGKENYGEYRKKVAGEENEYKHKVGKAFLREYLEGQLKIHGIEVKDGYVYAKKLRIVPDLLLNFPNGSIWAIDYVTGTKEDENYNNYIKKRITTYKEAGFRPFFFIDKSWLSVHPETDALSLYLAESQMMERTDYDEIWEASLYKCVSEFGDSILQRVMPNLASVSPSSYEVKSLVYIDPGEGESFITRFVPINQKWVNIIYKTSSISLERLVSLNQGKDGFALFAEDEEEAIRIFESRLKEQYDKFIVAEQLRQQRIDEERRRYEEEQRQRIQSLKEQSAEIKLNTNSTMAYENLYLSERDMAIVNNAKRKFDRNKFKLTSYNVKKYSEIFQKVENGEAITPQELILLTSLSSM